MGEWINDTMRNTLINGLIDDIPLLRNALLSRMGKFSKLQVKQEWADLMENSDIWIRHPDFVERIDALEKLNDDVLWAISMMP